MRQERFYNALSWLRQSSVRLYIDFVAYSKINVGTKPYDAHKHEKLINKT